LKRASPVLNAGKEETCLSGNAPCSYATGDTLSPRGPPAYARGASGTRVRRLSPGTYRAGDRGPPAPRPAWRGIQPSLAARRRWPSSSCAPRGRALTQESCGSTLRSRARREKAHRGATAGAAKPLPSRSGKRSAEPLEGVWGREESAARARGAAAPVLTAVPLGGRIGEARRSGRSCALPSRRGAGTSPGSPAGRGGSPAAAPFQSLH
jgi:hypothetical protein